MVLQLARLEREDWAFKPAALGVAPRFPAWRFRGQAEFLAFLKDHQESLDRRHLRQLSLATREKTLESQGTCAACRCPTGFCSAVNGEALSDGRRMPNWREELQCGCARRLNNRQRAVLHLAQACGLMGWMKTLLLNAPVDFALAYREHAPDCLTVGRFEFKDGKAMLPVEAGTCHFALSQDELQDVVPLESALRELARVLMPGGRLIFTVPFHVNEAVSLCGAGEGLRAGAHKFGWDLLERLRKAGFSEAEALLYWSEELGYLGNMNFAFLAVR
jgi:hypothetical protein